MIPTSAAYKAALAAAEMTPAVLVLVDWARDGWAEGDPLDDITRLVDEVEVDSALTTDLPASTRMVAGYASTQATVHLVSDPVDNTKTGSVLWSPYSAGSPYYGRTRMGAPCLVELGLQTADGPSRLPQVNGLVTGLDVHAGDRTASLSVLDGAEALRGPVHLPQMVSVDPLDDTMRPGLNSQAVIERILALGGFYASPPPRSDAVLAASLHGSAWPQVGVLRSAEAIDALPGQPVPYTPGVWGLALSASLGVSPDVFWDINPSPVDTGDAVLVEAWIERPGEFLTVLRGANAESGTLSNAGRSWQISIDPDGSVSWGVSRVIGSTATVDTPAGAIPADGGMHYVAVYAEFTATQMTATIRVDSTDTTATVLYDAAVQAAGTEWAVELFCTQRVESVQVATGVRSPVDWNNGWQPTAVLEPGLSELTAVPSTESSDGWALLQEIVGAEFGTLRFDGSGRAVFWNRLHWQGATASTVQRTLTATESILDLTTVELSAQAVNTVRVPVTPLAILPTGLVWQEQSPQVVPPHSTLTLWAQPSSGQFYGIDTTGWVIPAGGATGAAGQNKSGYRASRNRNGSGGQITNLTMGITPFADTVKIDITNPNPFEAWLVSPHGAASPNGGGTYPASSDGTPTVQLVGRLITSQTTPVDTTTVDPILGDTATVAEAALSGIPDSARRLYTAPDSPWRQSLAGAQATAHDLLAALYRPTPQIQGLSIVADPSLELGDRVQVEDPDGDGTKLADPFLVVGIHTTYTSSGMTQSLTLRPIAPPGAFLFGVTGRNIVGVTPL